MPRLNEAESKSIELPNVNGKAKTQSKSDRHAATASAAHQATVQDKATLAVRTQQQLVENQEPRRKRTGYRSRFAPEPQIRIASPRASPQSSGEYVPYSI